VLITTENENRISIAFCAEINSVMPPCADPTVFIAVADHFSFRAAALRLGVTSSATRITSPEKMRRIRSTTA
jgi:hypothetical protein